MSQQELSRLDEEAQQLLQRGDLAGAKVLYNKICELDSSNADSWFMLGTVSGQLGNIEESLSCLRRAIDLDSDFPAAHYNLGHLLRSQGHLDDALHHFKEATRTDPEYIDAWFAMGGIYGSQNRLADAETCSLRAVQLQPDSINARMNLANALAQQGKNEEAAQNYEYVTKLAPENSLAWLMLGNICKKLYRWKSAATAYQKTISMQPDNVEAHFGLATALQAQGAYLEALKFYQTATRIDPRHAEAYHGLGIALIQLGRQQEAVETFRLALQVRPDYAEAYVELAAALMPLSLASDEALGYCDRALEIIPGYADAISLAATIEQQSGQLEKASARLRPSVEQGTRSVNIALAYARVSKSLDQPEKAIPLLEDILNNSPQIAIANSRNMYFELGELYDAVGKFDQAFTNFQKGNSLRPVEFDPQKHKDYVNAIIEVHNKEFMAQGAGASVRSKRPIFIVGMPRSGTSLVEQILASHPSVFGAGELPDIGRIVGQLPSTLGSPSPYPWCMPQLTERHADTLCRSYLDRLSILDKDAIHVTDKLPENFLYLGLIQRLFPAAHVIHCVRDPKDTCLSCYFKDFSVGLPYTYDFQNLAEYYLCYRTLMAHWKNVLRIPIMDVHYEQLVHNQETVSRELLDFCGLKWDERCLRFHETKRFVSTGSYDQVRRPIYDRSIERWKHYESHLDILKKCLETPLSKNS